MSFLGDLLWEIGNGISNIPDNISMGIDDILYNASHPAEMDRIGEAMKAKPIESKPAHVKSAEELKKATAEQSKKSEYIYTPKSPRKTVYYGTSEPKVTKTENIQSKPVAPVVPNADIKVTPDNVYQKRKTKEGKTVMGLVFSNDKAKEMYEKKYQELKAIADEKVDDTAYLWDDTVKKYATKMEKVKRLLRTEGIIEQVTEKTFKDIDMFLERCSDAEFHIALVGTIKAGKSTLINAMLGYEYATTNVTPETASLTKFKNASNNYVKVVFYNDREWDALWNSAKESKATVFLEEYEKSGARGEKDNWLGKKDKIMVCKSQKELIKEIERWTSSKSACHYFVKEVEVGLENFDLPDGVVLVDTPGLDDVVEYRSNITREYIDRANAVLVCVKADTLTGPELRTILGVFSNTLYNPEKVYIVATQIDTLNNPKKDWVKQKEEWFKYLVREGAYPSRVLAEKNILPASAYLYILLKNYNSLGEEQFWELDAIRCKFRIRDINEHYQEMLDFTNIKIVKDKIQREIVANYKKLLVEDISGTYALCRDSICETLKKIKSSQEEIIKASQGELKDLNAKKEEYEWKYKETEEDRKELDEMLKNIKESTRVTMDKLERAIKNSY